MTCREKLALEHPDKIGVQYTADRYGCPFDYGYLAKEHCDCRDVTSCAECWNREIPEDIINKFNAIGNPNPVSADELRELIIDDKTRDIPTTSGSHILDSGDRTDFPSGAVRDMREGNGRCDLLPLDVVADILELSTFEDLMFFVESGEIRQLERILQNVRLDGMFVDVPTMLLEVAKHFEEDAKQYGDDNWKKGMPVRVFIDSAVRHYLKFLRGDKDEPHDRAFCWNIMCAIWTCKHKPELNNYARNEEESI